MAGFSIWNKLTEGNPKVGRAQLGHVEDGNCHVGNQECQSGFPRLQGRRGMEAGPGNFWNLCALRCILFIYFFGKITLVKQNGLLTNFVQKVPSANAWSSWWLASGASLFWKPCMVVWFSLYSFVSGIPESLFLLKWHFPIPAL